MKKGMTALVLFIYIALVLACLFNYNAVSNHDIRQRTYDRLQEGAAMQSLTLDAKLDGQYYVLESLAEYLDAIDHWDTKSSDDFVQMMASVVASGDYDLLSLADAEGTVLTNAGATSYAGDREYFKRSLNGERGLEKVLEGRVDNKPHFILSVPVYSDGEITGVLFGGFPVDVFYEIMISENTQDSGYAFVTDSAGMLVIDSPSAHFLSTGDSALDFYAQAVINGDITVEQIAEDLRQGNGNTISYSYNDNHRYATYTPLHINDWFIFNVTPASTVEAEAERNTQLVLLLTGGLMLISLLLIAYIIWQDRQRTRRLEQDKELLRQSEETYRMVAELSDSILFEGSVREDTMFFNQRFVDVFGRVPFMGKLSDLKQPNPFVHPDDQAAFMQLGHELYSHLSESTAEFRIINANRDYIWHRVEVMAMRDNHDQPYRILGKIINIDQQKREMAQLQTLAERDSLTGLYNHESMKFKVTDCLCNEGKDGRHALLILDIDDFKNVNDTQGHVEGDRVLIQLAQVMQTLFRSSDIVGRLGGDEFAVFLMDMTSEAIVTLKTRELCELANTVRIDPLEETGISISVGIALYREHGSSFEELYRNADIALYQAKKQGKNQFVLYGS